MHDFWQDFHSSPQALANSDSFGKRNNPWVLASYSALCICLSTETRIYFFINKKTENSQFKTKNFTVVSYGRPAERQSSNALIGLVRVPRAGLDPGSIQSNDMFIMWHAGMEVARNGPELYLN